jgi:integrase
MSDIWKKFYSNCLNQGLTKLRIHKLKTMYDVVIRQLNLETATKDDIEIFVNDLHSNKFTKQDGKPYSGSTKADIKKFLKQFYKWFKGENQFYPKEVAWIKTKIAKDERPKEKEVLTIEEVKKLSRTFDKPQFRLLILLLFDSGFRIQEMLSTRKKDLSFEEFNEDREKCWWISCNSSKTLTRKIPIPIFTEQIDFFVSSQDFKELKDNDLIFNVSYRYIAEKLVANAKRILNKKITCHALRHSSATYYAKELNGNVMELAQRYGWAFNSKELQTYIRRSGVYQKNSAKKVYSNQVSKLQDKNEQQEKELKNLKQQFKRVVNTAPDISQLKAQMDAMKKQQEALIQELKLQLQKKNK